MQVGSKITCLLSCNKEVSKTALNFLQCSVIHNDKPVDISMDSSQLKFEFSLLFNGEYHVTAQLYGQHVLGSPLTLPVAASALPGLLQLGYGVGGGTEFNLDEGSECVAKWTEDMVWYRARVDKVEGDMLEVTFLDYGNKEVVDKSHVARTALNIPEGEDVDDFVTKLGDKTSLLDRKHCMKFSIGEVVIAKWAEDNVWYNGEIIKLNMDDGKTAEVCFTDYGNTEEVEIMNIVKTKKEIPMKDDVDENVLKTAMKSNDESVNDCLRVGNTIKRDVDETKASDKCPQVGSIVVAKWMEDEVWYNAKVESITGEGYNVVFIDYGNPAIVKPEHILRSALDIPDNDCIDECVALGDTKSLVLDKSCRWSEGCACIAQWSEDHVWYNAAVDRDLGSGQYEVTFTDYGNKAVVAADKIVASTSDIPQDQVEMIDECVINNQNDVKEELKPEQKTLVNTKCNDSLKLNATDDSSQITIGKSNNPIDSESSQRLSSFSNLSGGSKCFACWSEDDVWYNAQIEKEEAPGVYVVTFTDYGNQETATADRIVFKVDEIPVDQRDMLDENVTVQTISDERVTQGKITAEVMSSEKQQVAKGESVIARWDEDGVWYNAVIENVAEDGRIEVTFTDYGNSTIVSREDMVSHAGDIPTDQTEMIDECVKIDKVPGENLVSHAEVEVPLSRIDEAMAYLKWDIKEERRAGEAGEKTNIFSRYKDLEKSSFLFKLNEALSQIIKMDDKEETKLLNLLKNFEKSPLMFSLTVEKEVIFVIGTGTLFEAARGNSKEREKVRRKGVSKWLNKLARIFKDDGIQNLVYNLGSISNSEKEARKIENSLDLESFTLFHPVDEDVVPPEAKDCFDRMLGEEEKVDWAGAIESSNTRRCPGPSPAVSLWPRLRRRYGSGKDKPQKAKHFQASGKYLKQFLKDLSFTCLLQNNRCAARILKYNEDQWEKDKDIIVATITESLTTWPFISFDDEGCGRWYQLGFYGESGWQVLLFDAFFPQEMMVVLEDDRSIVTGKNIHDDLAYILPNGGFGYNAVDLGVWTRDLQFHEHSKNGLKVLFQRSVGIDTEKLCSKKKDVETLKKYGYVRAGNWNTSEIDSRQILYMSSDVSLPGTVVFDIIIAIVLEVGVQVLDEKFNSFREFIWPYVENVIDRTWDNRKQSDWYEVPVTERSLLNNNAALRLSVPNFFSFEEEESESEKVLRRERFAMNIVINARMESYEKRLPQFMRHPISRGDKHLAEVREVEEMWN